MEGVGGHVRADDIPFPSFVSPFSTCFSKLRIPLLSYSCPSSSYILPLVPVLNIHRPWSRLTSKMENFIWIAFLASAIMPTRADFNMWPAVDSTRLASAMGFSVNCLEAMYMTFYLWLRAGL